MMPSVTKYQYQKQHGVGSSETTTAAAGGKMAGQDDPVLVIGATGQQGGAAARALLERGRAVRALVRDDSAPAARQLREAGASLANGDLDDADSVRSAMRSVSGVFLALTMMTGPRVTLPGVAAEERRGKAVAELTSAAVISHLVYSSISSAPLHTGIPHVESKMRIEEHIRALGLPATILRPVSFMDNFASLTRPAVEDGELVISVGLRPQTPLPLVAVRDIGTFAAIAFDDPGSYVARRLTLAGDCLTGPQIADVFAQAARRADGSKPVVGSSRNTSSGSPTRARAKSSRRRWPPDSLVPSKLAFTVRPTRARISSTSRGAR
jgi:uncharacterized protein YbjT (DUF2867 family)